MNPAASIETYEVFVVNPDKSKVLQQTFRLPAPHAVRRAHVLARQLRKQGLVVEIDKI
jgi:hypothetical protein